MMFSAQYDMEKIQCYLQWPVRFIYPDDLITWSTFIYKFSEFTVKFGVYKI